MNFLRYHSSSPVRHDHTRMNQGQSTSGDEFENYEEQGMEMLESRLRKRLRSLLTIVIP